MITKTTPRKKGASVVIEGQQIPWSFIQRIANLVGRDWDRVMDIFWKARNANNIMRYIQKGLIPNEKNQRYSLYPSRERDNGQMDKIRNWWHSNVYIPKKKHDPMAVRNIFKMLSEGKTE